jgi:hypothetical protein
MDMLGEGDKVGRVVQCYRDLLATGRPGYDLRRILQQSDYFDLPTSPTSEQERIRNAIAILGEYVASHFSEAERVELDSQIREFLGEQVIKFECAVFDRARVIAKMRVSYHLYSLSRVECDEFLNSLETLLTHEADPKFHPIEIYLFGPFAGARPLVNSNLNIAIVSDAFADMNLGQRKTLIQQLTNNTARLAAIGITFQEVENKYSLGDRKLLFRSRYWPGYAAQWELFPKRSTAAFKA